MLDGQILPVGKALKFRVQTVQFLDLRLEVKRVIRPPAAHLLGLTILAPMEYGLSPGSLLLAPALSKG